LWAKPHHRAAVAHLGRKDPVAALDSISKALTIEANNVSLLRVKHKAEALLHETQNHKRTTSGKPNFVAAAPCCSLVLFPEHVFFIDAWGCGDFADVEDALYECGSHLKLNNFTLILKPGVHLTYTAVPYTMLSDEARTVQIIGWNNKGGFDRASADDSVLQMGTSDVESHMSTISIIGGNMKVILQCLTIKQIATRSASHCVAVLRDVSAVIICAKHSTVVATCVRVSGTGKITFDVRENGSAELIDCEFKNCTGQAVSLYNKGKKISMTNCSVVPEI